MLLSCLQAALTHTEERPIPKPFILLALRCACQLFSDADGGDWVLSSTTFVLPPVDRCMGGDSSPRTLVSELLIHNLLAKDVTLRRTAAALAYNVATRVWLLRVGAMEHGPGMEASSTVQQHPQDDESWLVECVSALVEALREEEDEEVIHRLACALARFVLLGPVGLSQLLQVLEVSTLIKEKKQLVKRDIVLNMLTELAMIADCQVE
jgi:hypothetical protein